MSFPARPGVAMVPARPLLVSLLSLIPFEYRALAALTVYAVPQVLAAISLVSVTSVRSGKEMARMITRTPGTCCWNARTMAGSRTASNWPLIPTRNVRHSMTGSNPSLLSSVSCACFSRRCMGTADALAQGVGSIAAPVRMNKSSLSRGRQVDGEWLIAGWPTFRCTAARHAEFLHQCIKRQQQVSSCARTCRWIR